MSIKRKDERAVICTTDGAIYPCVAEAAKHYGVKPHDIFKVLRKQQKTTHKLVFGYVQPDNEIGKRIDEAVKDVNEEIKEVGRKKEAEQAKSQKKTSVIPVRISAIMPEIIEEKVLKIFGIPVWRKKRRIAIDK